MGRGPDTGATHWGERGHRRSQMPRPRQQPSARPLHPAHTCTHMRVHTLLSHTASPLSVQWGCMVRGVYRSTALALRVRRFQLP